MMPDWQGLLRLLFVLSSMAPISYSSADTLLPISLQQALDQHERVLAAQKDISVAEEGRRTAFAGYLPTVNATLYQGKEKLINADGSESLDYIHEESINLTQSLFDFGMTAAQVDIAELGIERAAVALRSIRENLLMEGVSAYLGLEKMAGRVDYALQSEENIKEQTGMEESLVETGAGIPSDVLQTKAQLTGTQALRVQEEGQKQLAESRYWAVFGEDPADKPAYLVPEPPLSKLPVSLAQALQAANRHNAEIELGRLDIKIAKETIRNQKATAQPKLSFNLDYKQSTDNAKQGTAKVQLSWPLYNGGREQSAVDSSTYAHRATVLRLEDTRKRVHEAVRIAWYNWKTAKETASLLKNQSNIALEFLEQARVERKLGTRTLQDVLTGETAYLSAISNAVSADIDYKIAAYQLLTAMGLLEESGGLEYPEPLSSEEESQAGNGRESVVTDLSTPLERAVDKVVDKAPIVVESGRPAPQEMGVDPAVDEVPLASESAPSMTVEPQPVPAVSPFSVGLVGAAEERDADHTIYFNRSAYQNDSKKIQVQPTVSVDHSVKQQKSVVEIRGRSSSRSTNQSGVVKRAMIEVGVVEQKERSTGVELRGPGGVITQPLEEGDPSQQRRHLMPLR